MIAKKTRDVKFMIYLGLYLFVIAFITIQGATIVDLGPAPDPRDTTIARVALDSILKLPLYDPSKDFLTRKPGEDSTIIIVANKKEANQQEISPGDYARLKNENAQLKNQNSSLRAENQRLQRQKGKSVDD